MTWVQDIVSQNHQQLVLLELVDRNMTEIAGLPFERWNGVGVVAYKVSIHALKLCVAEDGSFQRLVGHRIDKFDRKIAFESK